MPIPAKRKLTAQVQLLLQAYDGLRADGLTHEIAWNQLAAHTHATKMSCLQKLLLQRRAEQAKAASETVALDSNSANGGCEPSDS